MSETVEAAGEPVYATPTSLSPSRVESFTSCPLKFRFSSIDKLPEVPAVHTTKGSLVHRALELAFLRPPEQRVPDVVRSCLVTARDEYRSMPEFTLLGLDGPATQQFDADCATLVERYLTMEDPTAIRPIGIELRLEAHVGDLRLRGIIDRLELDADGELVVTDYKTGRAPGISYEQKRLAGVHFYALLCQQVFGKRPAAIRLMYLSSGETITAVPSEQSVHFIVTRTQAVWKAIDRACHSGTFLHRQGPLCPSCSFQRWCPAFGGDPARAGIDRAVPGGAALDGSAADLDGIDPDRVDRGAFDAVATGDLAVASATA